MFKRLIFERLAGSSEISCAGQGKASDLALFGINKVLIVEDYLSNEPASTGE